MMRRRDVYAVCLLILLASAACRNNDSPTLTPNAAELNPPSAEVQATVDPAPQVPNTPLPTVIPPTPTPTEPLAALVNDRPIFLSEYEMELSRYEQAQAELVLSGFEPTEGDYRRLVLDALVERELIAQAAEAQGIEVTPGMVEEKLQELRTAAGESTNFDAWLEANQWTLEEFRTALAGEMLTELVVASVTAEVPEAVEQVRARYLQVDDPDLAQSLLAQVRSGGDFAALALEHSLDRVTGQNGGDLGYFARGSLLVPAVEAAAFGLAPGDTSDVITETSADGSEVTYYLVQVIERDPQRLLTADLRYAMLQQSFESWLTMQWENATVIRLLDTDA